MFYLDHALAKGLPLSLPLRFLPKPKMRLIEVDGLSLRPDEFDENKIGPYAILSHTWEKDELKFSDFEAKQTGEATIGLQRGDHRSKAGFQKLYRFANVAKEHRIPRVWMDTCCIDKANSTELQQSLNSMYRWYERATMCIIYLSDFELEMKDVVKVS